MSIGTSRCTLDDPYHEPRTCFSLTSSSIAMGISMICSILGTPTMIACPPRRAIASACCTVCLEPDHLERDVDAATAGELLHLRDRVAVLRVHEVGGAELLGELELRVELIDRDDALGALPLRALDHVEADTAATDDRDGVARARRRRCSRRRRIR